jgi:mono/diheme cytochrome c family protein
MSRAVDGRRLGALAIACGLLAAPLLAQAQDPAEGVPLAKAWCAGCHAIDAEGAGNEIAPRFETIMSERGRSEEWLEAWLSVPHETMPNLSLSRLEIANLVAYLNSLRGED